jgi:hypothetical protein
MTGALSLFYRCFVNVISDSWHTYIAMQYTPVNPAINSLDQQPSHRVPRLLFALLLQELGSTLSRAGRWMTGFPSYQRFMVALKGLIVALEDAGVTARSAAFFDGGLAGWQWAGIIVHVFTPARPAAGGRDSGA